ncbi:hypothetical protein EX895_001485 [Sporisorium graminicola]|uniref:RING-type E3 ubiquitin transferase n=1 Tax=Sporisorium graminicola TaxID=280036 RepID=A0A4U7KYR4_9BASI|nr:hypothetical protein EX895_001485 [Sporisorium graminicola]TKY89700.1 hypothetical protein EX895_001485 [Sporisorium graminicola]
MDPPSADSGGGDSSASPRSSSINQMAYCHECGIEIRPLMTPDPTCPRCNGQFVEIIDQNSAGQSGDDQDDDYDDETDNPFALPGSRDPFSGFAFRTGSIHGGGSLPQTLNSLLMALTSGTAPGPTPGTQRDPDASGFLNQQQSNRSTDAADRDQQGSSSTNRSGSTSFGPFGLQWNVQYGSGGGDPYRDHYQRATEQPNVDQRRQHDLNAPPTLSNFLRFAFGGADSTDDNATHRNSEDTYFHDDGMGGAGGVADGRHFNHDNRGTYHQPPQSPSNDTTGRNTGGPQGGSMRGSANNDLPPELGALRNLFTGLFGEPGAQGGSLLDLLAAGAQGGAGGPRGQWGDYVLGQQGLDDIISQLMEQTQGSTAPPPATEDVIDKLERFTLDDKQRIEKARNQDCPTCKDEFLPSPAEAGDAQTGEQEKDEDEEQQQDLISMPCGHIFHVDCLVPWLRMHGTCPVCRISIAKPQEESASSGHNDSESTGQQPPTASAAGSGPIPGGWPSPPNPFTSFFGSGNADQGVQIPRDSPEATTTTYHPQPPTSTTVTSTVYPTAPVASGMGGATGEVVNSIISSPPIVSDREEFFAEPAEEQPASREEMRETLRRAAEARRVGGRGATSQPSLEPDELD